MRLDYHLRSSDGSVADEAAAAEAAGYSGAYLAETRHDPLILLASAATRTARIALGTGITVAFARSPMTTAVAANDLQLLSSGRFEIGLGSQVKAHIERRFSMPWSQPAARMREYIAAVRAIWHSWNTGERLDFRGDFYTHTLMTPDFSPGPNPYGVPQVAVAAVGEKMAEVAGEVADTVVCHSFTTVRYLRDVTVPALERGRQRAGDGRRCGVALSPFVATGTTAEEFERAKDAVRGRIGFYGSTPAYRPVLERHGWGDLQTELNALAKAARWGELATLVDDEVLQTFAVVAEPDKLGAAVADRFAGVVDRVALYAPYEAGSALTPAVGYLSGLG